MNAYIWELQLWAGKRSMFCSRTLWQWGGGPLNLWFSGCRTVCLTTRVTLSPWSQYKPRSLYGINGSNWVWESWSVTHSSRGEAVCFLYVFCVCVCVSRQLCKWLTTPVINTFLLKHLGPSSVRITRHTRQQEGEMWDKERWKDRDH